MASLKGGTKDASYKRLTDRYEELGQGRLTLPHVFLFVLTAVMARVLLPSWLTPRPPPRRGFKFTKNSSPHKGGDPTQIYTKHTQTRHMHIRKPWLANQTEMTANKIGTSVHELGVRAHEFETRARALEINGRGKESIAVTS